MTTREVVSHDPWLISACCCLPRPNAADIVVDVLVPVRWRPVFHQLGCAGPLTQPPLPANNPPSAEGKTWCPNQAYPKSNRLRPPALMMARLLLPCTCACLARAGKVKKKTGGALIRFGSLGRSPLPCAGRGGPNAAMLQLARRPAITGFGFCTARAADSGSRKITCV